MGNLEKIQIGMTSKEVAEITGKDHSNVLRDCRSLIEEVGDGFKFESVTYKAGNGEERPMYFLEKESVQLLITGYSAIIRLAVIKRLNELESVFSKPRTHLEVIQSEMSLLLENERKNVLLLEAKPKVDFYEAVTGSIDTIDMASVAKILNITGFGRNLIFDELRKKSVLQSNNQPYQKYVDNGWFRVIESKYSKQDGSTHISLKTVVYQKGLDGIRKLLSK